MSAELTDCSCLRPMTPLEYQIPNPIVQPFAILTSTSALFPSPLDHPHQHYMNTCLFLSFYFYWYITYSFRCTLTSLISKGQFLTPPAIYFSALHDSKTPRRSYVHCLQIPFLPFSLKITPIGFCFLIFPSKLLLLSRSATTSKLLNPVVNAELSSYLLICNIWHTTYIFILSKHSPPQNVSSMRIQKCLFCS